MSVMSTEHLLCPQPQVEGKTEYAPHLPATFQQTGGMGPF